VVPFGALIVPLDGLDGLIVTRIGLEAGAVIRVRIAEIDAENRRMRLTRPENPAMPQALCERFSSFLSYPLVSVPGMSTFVLVPGAWLGAWVWAPVVAGLRAMGHDAHALTLSGLAGEVYADDPEKIGLTTHVRDVLTVLEGDDLRGAILVGHSYAGMVAGQVADWARDRVAHTVFLDANLPADGQAMTDEWSERGRELVRAGVTGNGGLWPVPEIEDFDGHDLDPEQVSWILGHALAHPGHTLFEPALLTRPMAELSATYVTCMRPYGQLRRRPRVPGSWWRVELDTGHWPMVSRPHDLVSVLDEIASTVDGGEPADRQ
jgi:pimeloyl-ACP methyl ester carboxylesterase